MLHTEAVENKSAYIFEVLEWNPLNPTLSARKILKVLSGSYPKGLFL